MFCTIYVAKAKALIILYCRISVQQICDLNFAKSRFSHDAAQMADFIRFMLN